MAIIDATGISVTTHPRKGWRGEEVPIEEVRLSLHGDRFYLSFREPEPSSPKGKHRGIRAMIVIPKEVVDRMAGALAQEGADAPLCKQP